MLRSLKDLEGYTVCATDGEVGNVVNFLLDDHRWVSRYLVVTTGAFLSRQSVLISPISFRRADWATHLFHVALTKAKITLSPDTDTDLPVSRQHEQAFSNYYGYMNYWGSTGIWGTHARPSHMAALVEGEGAGHPAHDPGGDQHLRSAKAVRGYHIQGTDGSIGHVEDFIVDDESWEIRYLVIDTSNWWRGKKVLVSPHWATRISWEDSMIDVGLSRKEIENSPAWDPSAPVNRRYEACLYDYYGRPNYWDAVEEEASSEEII